MRTAVWVYCLSTLLGAVAVGVWAGSWWAAIAYASTADLALGLLLIGRDFTWRR